MIMKLSLIIKVIILEKEKEQIQIRQMGPQPTQMSHADRIWVAFSIVKIRLRHVHILNVDYVFPKPLSNRVPASCRSRPYLRPRR